MAQTSLDQHLVLWLLVIINAPLLIGVIAFALVGSVAFWKVEKGAGKSFGLMFQRGNFLRIITVIVIVEAATALALANKLSEGAVGLLSGVAGAAIGGIDKKTESELSSASKE